MQQSDQAQGGAALTPLDPALSASPIDYLHAVHLCKRELCALLERIADGGAAPSEDIEAATAFLSDEFPTHLEDEEQDLFQLLRLRCERDDDIDRLLDKLMDDHRHAHFDATCVIKILQSAASGLGAEDITDLRRFAGHARRHLILEKAVLMPFARLRLTEADLETFRASMRRRRGLETNTD
jgi:hemerythrin-like domain-containing protein